MKNIVQIGTRIPVSKEIHLQLKKEREAAEREVDMLLASLSYEQRLILASRYTKGDK